MGVCQQNCSLGLRIVTQTGVELYVISRLARRQDEDNVRQDGWQPKCLVIPRIFIMNTHLGTAHGRVKTRHHTYTLETLKDGHTLLSGHPQHCPEAVDVNLMRPLQAGAFPGARGE